MRKGILKRILAGFMAFALMFISVDTGCITALAADIQAEAKETEKLSDAVETNKSATGTATGYIDLGTVVERVDNSVLEEGGLAINKTTVIPESYSSVEKGYVTSIKDQNPWGTCWAFAACASMESYALAHGLVDSADDVDFSEYALVYLTHMDDLYIEETGDYTTTTDPYIGFDFGGNDQFAFKALSKWAGIYNEDDSYYNSIIDQDKTEEEIIEYVPDENNMDFVFTGQKYINIADSDQVKAAVMEHGAVAVAYYHDDAYTSGYGENNEYYDTPYLYNFNYETSATNHAVTLVGWDDTISKELFTMTDADGVVHTPENDGAWLIKNSWGDWAGEDGYIWISYEDMGILSSNAVVYEVAPKSEYDNIYQHDGATPFMATAYGTKFASVYTVVGEAKQRLEAISFALYDSDKNYTVKIYDNSDGSILDEGTLLANVSGATTYVGYYTVDMPADVVLEKGDVFSVVISFEQIVYMIGGYSVEAGPFTTVCSDEAGQSYQYYYGWNDVSEGNYSYVENLCIKAFTSDAESLPEITVSDIAEQTYSGSPITPDVVVTTADSVTLTKGTDYTVSYNNNTNVGTATVTVTFIGDYARKEAITKEFKIIAKTLSAANVSAIPNQKFIQENIEPELVIKDGEYTLVKNTDYTVTYENNYSIGTAKANVTFCGNYDGTATVSFNIVAKTFDDLTFAGFASQIYDGNAKTPDIVLKYGDYTLVKDVDFIVTYANNVNAGDATAQISFIGKFSDISNKELQFEILPFEVKKEKVEIAGIDSSYEYTGVEVTFDPLKVQVTLNNVILQYESDYVIGYSQNINVGEAQYTITFLNNYSGEISGTFTIVPKEIVTGDALISGLDEAVMYSGSLISYENIVISVGNDSLTYGNDFAVAIAENSQSDGVNVGTVALVITFKGNYAGTLTTSYEIIPYEVNSEDIIVIDKNNQSNISFEYEYTGQEILPEFDVTVNGIDEEIEYEIVYLPAEGTDVVDKVNVGTISYKVILKGNYTGVAETSFTIIPKPGNKLTVLDIEAVEYAHGEEIKPEVIVKDGDVTLVAGTDYDVFYNNNIDAGDAVVTVVYKGNYSGSSAKIFKILPVKLDTENLSVELMGDSTFTGLAIVPEILLSCGELTSEDGTLEYIIEFAEGVDHTNVGEQIPFTVTLTGNYEGSVTGMFNISPMNVEESDSIKIGSIAEQKYTGEAITPAVVIRNITENGSITLEQGEDKDYTVKYANNTGIGKATVTITFHGNYTGERTVSFVIIDPIPDQITSDDVSVDETTRYISKISVGTLLKDFMKTLKEKEYVKVFKGEIEVGSEDVIGTGMFANIMDGDQVSKSYTIIVTGDTNGDGKINITDMIAAKACVLKKSNLTGAYEKAADVNGDGKINITDFIKIKAVTLKKDTIIGVTAQ